MRRKIKRQYVLLTQINFNVLKDVIKYFSGRIQAQKRSDSLAVNVQVQLDFIAIDEAEEMDREVRESDENHNLGDSSVMPGRLSDYLEILVRVIQRQNEGILLRWDSVEYVPESFYARPNADFTQRKYFVGRVTEFFFDHLSRKERRLTAICTSAAFDLDPPISERQVRRLTQ